MSLVGAGRSPPCSSPPSHPGPLDQTPEEMVRTESVIVATEPMATATEELPLHVHGRGNASPTSHRVMIS
ncbi:hypothetical protein BV898_12419 [Hypsibius exemplaris]|uniref:Uncharacterized protein n=1 Tax=Hypsibius exemplaris TaxID=2072580 RepID=A0A1W0WDU4_HYPEX|nr:hypothetical protein BV898_12419 [Hypsibius exemplaris]